jgi:hypothetical protein
VRDGTKFPNLVGENYLINTVEIGPLGKPIMEPVQWIMGLYNPDIMNLLDIQEFRRGKNVRLCIKQLVTRVHVGILWIDRPIQLDVALISKITCLPTFGAQPEEYLDNKACEKEIAELVKAQLGTSQGNKGIMLKDINENATSFTSKLIACKLLRKCRKEEALARVIVVVAQCTKGVMFN